ncbi:UNVERIFIED_CONTAM: putative folate-biopterin transporter 2 [Sesamum angustifolium]|uniref:Folate-biopterin transporter 2 n=1 Tax=Sesamum angustifolium TaxID=2727405 RepID=A0AAW2MH92_9LAMI
MMGEEERLPTHSDEVQENEQQPKNGIRSSCCAPVYWFKMLAKELHWSFVFGVIIVYGMSQGLGGALARVGTEYYMKDVQKVQPSEAQVYSGITSIPWIVKPLWGLLTDVVPISGYQRRPYFVFAGSLGVIAMLFLSLHKELHIVLALLALTAGSASVAIADVTVDACVAQKSGSHPSLAADMQSLCALSSSIGALVGFSFSGIFVHLIGPQGVYGLLTLPAGLVFIVGILLKEPRTSSFAYEQINQSFLNAGKAMWKTLKCPDVWRPCLYMYLSFSLSLNISEGCSTGPQTQRLAHHFLSVSQMIGRLKWMPLLVLSSKLCPPGIEGTFFALLMSIDNAGLLTSSWLGGLLLHILNVTRTEFGNFWLAIMIRNVLRISPLFLLFLVPRTDPNASILPDEVLNSKEVAETRAPDNVELVALVESMDGR